MADTEWYPRQGAYQAPRTGRPWLVPTGFAVLGCLALLGLIGYLWQASQASDLRNNVNSLQTAVTKLQDQQTSLSGDLTTLKGQDTPAAMGSLQAEVKGMSTKLTATSKSLSAANSRLTQICSVGGLKAIQQRLADDAYSDDPAIQALQNDLYTVVGNICPSQPQSGD